MDKYITKSGIINRQKFIEDIGKGKLKRKDIENYYADPRLKVELKSIYKNEIPWWKWSQKYCNRLMYEVNTDFSRDFINYVLRVSLFCRIRRYVLIVFAIVFVILLLNSLLTREQSIRITGEAYHEYAIIT